MAQIREISERIGSVKSTQKITRAMKMVASARLNRATARMDGIRKYGSAIARSLVDISSNLYGDEHPLLKPHAAVKHRLFIIIAGDRGLCGGFNSNVVRFCDQHISGEVATSAKFFTVGRRAIAGIKKRFGEKNVVKQWTDVFDKLSFQLTNDIAKHLLTAYQAKNPADVIDEVYLVYNRFSSRIKQEVVKELIMPLSIDELKKDAILIANADKTAGTDAAKPKRLVYELHPDPVTAASALVEHYLSVNIFHAITESYAAELSARVTAMESATDAAQEMVDNLTLLYNRARQAGITNELLDIIGGANAL